MPLAPAETKILQKEQQAEKFLEFCEMTASILILISLAMLFAAFLLSKIRQKDKKSDDNFTKASHQTLKGLDQSDEMLNRKDILDQEMNLKYEASSASSSSDWGLLGPNRPLYFLEFFYLLKTALLEV